MLTLSDLSFAYGTIQTLHGISAEMSPGRVTCVIGRNGVGKTTLLKVIMGILRSDRGSIHLDDQNITSYAASRRARHGIALVPQDPVIFATSARENIRFGWPEASDEAVEAAAQAAAAHEFIAQLPMGYDSQLGERGVMLSGGQKQRIAIARAILRDAPVLLLDEATSALDAQSEKLVQAALDRLAQGRTTLVIAHRLSTVRNADRIVVMDRGRAVDSGTHDELLARGGLYARLHALQFSDGDTTVPEPPDPRRADSV